jgi:hypothetical protein
MRQINLRGLRNARVWQGELPDLRYPPGGVVDSVIEVPRGTITQPGCAAVEAMLVYEPHSHYGLLGASFVPDERAPLRIRIVESAEDGEPLANSLSAGHDDIRAGLPPELVEYILQGALSAPELTMFGGGEIRFDCAAHGRNSTSPIIVVNLARAVIALLSLQDEPVSAEQLSSVLLARS